MLRISLFLVQQPEEQHHASRQEHYLHLRTRVPSKAGLDIDSSQLLTYVLQLAILCPTLMSRKTWFRHLASIVIMKEHALIINR